MNLYRAIAKKIRWHIIDVMARLGIGDEEIIRRGYRPAYGRAEPRLLTIAEGNQCFDAHDALHGSYSSCEHCAGVPYSLWADINGLGECIRYFPAGLASQCSPLALLFFPGDIVLRTARGVRLVSETYTRQSPHRLTELMEEWTSDAGAPALYMGRPGIFGSSGDHEKRRLPYEVHLMNRALDLLRQRHHIDRFILVGQSGGAQIVAALLNRRQDIAAAVLTAGLLSVHSTVGRWRRTRPVPGGATYPVREFYDPITEVERIPRNPQPAIYLISDPRDGVVSLHSQLLYLRRLQSEGIEAHHVYGHGAGRKRHNLGAHGRKAAALLARGATAREIRQALVDLDIANIQMERNRVGNRPSHAGVP